MEEKVRYRTCYCGLCRSLGKLHGLISRITLTYDMTLLILVLTALYEDDCQIKTGRCIMHPLEQHEYWQNEFTDYAADMNVALAYYNFLDDWNDSKKLFSLCEAKLFEQEYRRIAVQHPDKCNAIVNCIAELSELEKTGVLNPDVPAGCFGNLIGEIFAPRSDQYTGNLRAFGKSLGKFIYIMDACMDLKADIRKERYNPMIATPSENFVPILNLLMADCTGKFERLPVGRDRKLIENILYSGIWTRYEAENMKQVKQVKQMKQAKQVKQVKQVKQMK